MKRIAVLPHAFARRVAALDKPVRMGLAGTLALSTIAAGSLVYAASASAVVPEFPNNIVVFPNRDFVSIEGYEEHVGKTMTVTVTRDGQVTGKASGAVEPGGVALEVNHPGGVCWGNDPSYPQVTPDILPGDKVSIAISDTSVDDDTTTGSGTAATVAGAGDAAFNGPPVEVVGNVLKIRGKVGADIVLAQSEQRIINPDMTDTVIQRRDVRAVPGPLTPAPRGGYSSQLEFDTAGPTGPANFLATYVFDDIPGAPLSGNELATLASEGGTRYMSWQVEDLDANRQGLTIAEFGELGGPGFGGCPNGPLQSGPPAPGGISATKTTSGSGETVTFAWTPAAPVPGTPAITGYRVRAIGAPDGNGNQAEVGLRVNDPAATGATLQVPFTPYTLEVTSRNAENNETNPPATPTAQVPDEDPPTVTIAPRSGAYVGATEFTIESDEPGEIYYQLSPLGVGTTPPTMHLGGGVLSGDETLYEGPITLDADTRLSAVSIDAAGNVSVQDDVELTFSAASPPAAAPDNVDPTPGNGSFTVTWDAVTATPAVTGYVITWTGPESGSVDVTTATPLSKTVTGLAPGDYDVSVAAKNVGGTGLASTPITITVTEQLAVSAGADGTVARGGAPIALDATTPNDGVQYQWERVTADSLTAPVAAGPSFLSSTTDEDPVVTVPNIALPNSTLTAADAADVRATAFYFRVTVSKGTLTVARDVVRLTVSNQPTVTIATGRYRAGSELRLNGSVTNGTTQVRVYRKTNGATDYTFVGNATLTVAPGGATWELRLRNGAVPPNQPWYAFTTNGGGVGPFNT